MLVAVVWTSLVGKSWAQCSCETASLDPAVAQYVDPENRDLAAWLLEGSQISERRVHRALRRVEGSDERDRIVRLLKATKKEACVTFTTAESGAFVDGHPIATSDIQQYCGPTSCLKYVAIREYTFWPRRNGEPSGPRVDVLVHEKCPNVPLEEYDADSDHSTVEDVLHDSNGGLDVLHGLDLEDLR